MVGLTTGLSTSNFLSSNGSVTLTVSPTRTLSSTKRRTTSLTFGNPFRISSLGIAYVLAGLKNFAESFSLNTSFIMEPNLLHSFQSTLLPYTLTVNSFEYSRSRILSTPSPISLTSFNDPPIHLKYFSMSSFACIIAKLLFDP
ncbi:142aa long hypothetical protein [Pyrococcus horikoshii OT3]|uniref:Uncharacterized protein n=1 Tax=Pyrococcus horikoshii (strain ATCC 700860 / DSM 12428 / JCM 9974 / NBRC 100139 / OT-3) TaxID=70601 RepID=O58726_PYRHO|nr:142aa long hypothetical protein [Pyrococcus horikoshii OT3]